MHERTRVEPEEVRVCVLYDPSTGEVVHAHKVSTLPGGRKLDDATMEARIRELAKSHGADSSALKVLHVDHKAIVFGAKYTVKDGRLLHRRPERSRS